MAPVGLSDADLAQVFGRPMEPGIDAGDLYFQRRHHEAWGGH